jgi:hypothetical protein
LPPFRRWWQAADLWKKPVADRRSKEKTGLYIFTCISCGGADWRQKIGWLTVPAVAAASQIVGLQGADRMQLKSGMVTLEMNQKYEPSSG